MNAIEQALKQLKATAGVVNSEIISDLINEHKGRRNNMLALYERYKASEAGVPIFTREFADENKINNKLNNDYFSDIVDTKIGYFMGKPISYVLGGDYSESERDRLNKTITDFSNRNNMPDLDAETAKMAAICGYGARLCYINEQGFEQIMNIAPWEVIFVTDMSINEPQYALRYYPVKIKINQGWVERVRVEWYNDSEVSFYLMDANGNYKLEGSDTEPQNPKKHLFDGVPLMGFPNSEEMLGDTEKVLNLIDGYDNTLSDVNSEIEQFRLAYLKFVNCVLNEEALEKAKKSGAFELPEGADADFLTKNLNDTLIENHLNRLDENILRFAKSVNFTDKAFGGNISGVAMKFKIFNLEAKCIIAERKFAAALRQMFKIIASAWDTKGIKLNYTDIDFKFSRNLPLNLKDEAETTQILKGQISESTRLSLLSFVEDVPAELGKIEEERELLPDLDADDIIEDEDEPGQEA